MTKNTEGYQGQEGQGFLVNRMGVLLDFSQGYHPDFNVGVRYGISALYETFNPFVAFCLCYA